MRARLNTPGILLTSALVIGSAVMVMVIALALSRPWLGLTLRWDSGHAAAAVVESHGPAAHIPAGTLITALGDGRRTLALEAIDLTIEPDGNLPTYDDYRRFLDRQGRIASLQAAPVLYLTDSGGGIHEVRPAAARPAPELPPDFWIQLAVGFLCWMIAAGVWSFRPRDPAACFLLVTGFATLMFSPGAAVYTTRELAVPLGWLLMLKTMNFGGGMLYLSAMAALMWHYPRRLGPTWVSVGIVLAGMAWYAAQVVDVFDSMLVGRRLPVFVALALTIALGVRQWLGTRRDPVARASLKWFLLSWLVGISGVILLSMVPQLYGIDTGAIQGYSFLLMLLVYGGLAFGITRFRLFELGDWWFRIVLWLSAAFLFLTMDLLLLLVLDFSSATSLGLALVVCGFIWLPLRGWLWRRLLERPHPGQEALFRGVIDVSLAVSPEERVQRGRALFGKLFDPLLIERTGEGAPVIGEPRLVEHGLVMELPAQGQTPALRVGYPGRGRRLFNHRDLALARTTLDMLEHADNSRRAYQQGAVAERSRIARDLHDDIGSHLLTALHHPDGTRTKETVRLAMAEMQTIIHGLAGHTLSLAHVIGELRHETQVRMDATGIALAWPLDDACADTALTYDIYKHYLSIMRELFANIIRHAGATRVRVDIRCEDGRLLSRIGDDGQRFNGEHPGHEGGHGLFNLQRRLQELGGTLRYDRGDDGNLAELDIPLRAAD